MARCGCASTCSCLVIAGNHVTVTGNGSQSNPYIVTADAMNVEDENVLLSADVTTMDFLGAGVTAAAGAPGEVVLTIPGYTDEQARDTIGSALVAGTGIGITVNDAGDTITIATTGAGYTDEQARDIVGTALRAGTGIVIVVDDAADTITISATAQAAPKETTAGAGLPTTVGRVVGDHHFDLTTGRDHVLVDIGGVLTWVFADPQFFQGIVPGAITVANHVLKPGIRIPAPTTVRVFVVRVDAPIGAGGSLTVVARRFNNGVDTGDNISVTVAAGQAVASTTGAVLTAQGDVWKFDVTAATGSPTDMLLSLDAWG